MSAGPKIFLLRTSNVDFNQFQDDVSQLYPSSCYLFNKLDDLNCFKGNEYNNNHSFFVFILPFESVSLIASLKQCFQSCKCLVIDSTPSLSRAVHSSERGADKYLTPEAKSVLSSINKMIKSGTEISQMLNSDDFFCHMIGRSSVMKDVFAKIEQVAKSSSTILITGASGCGKELVAKAIHELSSRNSARKISINCGAIPSDLLESELFGHVKGAFTGAITDKKGKFELADKGTLFLDEIGDMDQKLQVKLLRALQSKQIEAVGDDFSRDIDVRIIAATHQNLDELVEQKKFREDLYYRLNVIPIELPELKKRKEDIPLLITHFIKVISQRDHIELIKFSESALKLLINYQWPGNIRELENLIERLMVLKSGHYIEAVDLPNYIFSQQVLVVEAEDQEVLPEQGIDLKKHLATIELGYIKQALERTNGNKKHASELLSIKRTTLVEKIKKIPELNDV